MKKIEPYFFNQDVRGLLRGITQGNWEEVNYVETAAGSVRGGHYHEHTIELFYFIKGEVRITIEHIQTGERGDMVAGAGDIVQINPMETHTLVSTTDASWINILSERMNPLKPDILKSGQ